MGLLLPVTGLAPCFPVTLLVTVPTHPGGTRRWELGGGRMRWPREDDTEGHSQHKALRTEQQAERSIQL